MKRTVFASSLALTGLATSLPTRSRAQATSALAVGASPTRDVAPALYAAASGMFARAGLDVRLEQIANGATTPAVVGGALQIGFASIQGVIAAHTRGVPLQLVAPGGMYADENPYAYLFVRSGSPIRRGRDLDGKIIASPQVKDLDWLANAAWVDANGGTFASMKQTDFPDPALLQALVDGRVDAYSVGQPWATVALDSRKVRVLGKSFSAIAPHFLMTGWYAMADVVARQRDAMERFARVLHDAALYVSTHPAEVAPLVASWTKVDPRLVARIMAGGWTATLDAALIQPLIDACARYGLIEHGFAAQEIISQIARNVP